MMLEHWGQKATSADILQAENTCWLNPVYECAIWEEGRHEDWGDASSGSEPKIAWSRHRYAQSTRTMVGRGRPVSKNIFEKSPFPWNRVLPVSS
jgi:hypothetical protein